MILPTRLAAKAKLSVEVNDVYMFFELAPDAIHRFVRPALFSTGDDIFELRKFGTALICRYRGIELAITTLHQTDNNGVDKPKANNFVIITKDEINTVAVPPKLIHTPDIDDIEFKSLEDLQFFDYHDQFSKKSISSLNLNTVYWSNDHHEGRDYSFVLGYPTESDDLELVNDDEVGARVKEYVSKWIRQDLQVDTPKPLDTEHRNMFIKHPDSNRISIDPDGLSGSPVFSIIKKGNERHLLFEGIVTNAKGDRFAIYPSLYIKQMLDKVIKDRSP